MSECKYNETAVNADGKEYCTYPGSVTPTTFNGYMKLGPHDWIDPNGVEHFQDTPEGYLKADHITWNAKLPDVEDLVNSLPKDARFRVMISEV